MTSLRRIIRIILLSIIGLHLIEAMPDIIRIDYFNATPPSP